MFKREKTPELEFTNRSEAFKYMLSSLLQKGEDPLEAAKKANEFAEIFAVNMGIPVKVEPELKGVDKYISIAEKIGNYAQKNPKVVELLLGGATFLVGLFTGKKVEEHQQQEDITPPQEPIDFANVQ